MNTLVQLKYKLGAANGKKRWKFRPGFAKKKLWIPEFRVIFNLIDPFQPFLEVFKANFS